MMFEKTVLAVGVAASLLLSSCGAIGLGDDNETSLSEDEEAVATVVGEKPALGERAVTSEAVEVAEAPDETTTPETTPPTEIEPSSETSVAMVDVFSIEVGDCFADPDSDEVLTIFATSCENEHKYQAYYKFDIISGVLPTGDQMTELASGRCRDEFEKFVGTDYESSELYLTWLEPTQASWDEGDREIVCELFAPDRLLSIDAKDSGL